MVYFCGRKPYTEHAPSEGGVAQFVRVARGSRVDKIWDIAVAQINYGHIPASVKKSPACSGGFAMRPAENSCCTLQIASAFSFLDTTLR